MTIDEILTLETEQLDELLKCVGKLLSDAQVQSVEKNGTILLDPNNPNDRDWYANDQDYDIV